MLTPEKIAELKAAHGPDLTLHDLGAIQLVTRPVDLKAWRAFRRRVFHPVEQSQAGDELLYEVLVYPTAEQARAYFDRQPLALDNVRDDVCKEAGSLTSWSSVAVDAEGNETLVNGKLRVTVRPVSGTEGRLYQRRLDDPQMAPGAAEWLLQLVVVTPEWTALEAQIHGQPFVLDRLLHIVTERAGRAVEVRSKKL